MNVLITCTRFTDGLNRQKTNIFLILEIKLKVYLFSVNYYKKTNQTKSM